MKKGIIILISFLLAGSFLTVYFLPRNTQVIPPTLLPIQQQPENKNVLSIAAMREKSYPGSDITIEQTLPDGPNFHQYIASYRSDGLKIHALLTIPFGQKPANGWPVIIFNHGYIAPETYQTFPSSGQYSTYYPIFAGEGYIVFKPDYRGHGNSEGRPEGAYYSPAYATDTLNALASVKKLPDANSSKIGVWGHSMGGNIILRNLVVNDQDIKVAVIWAGVVGSYNDMMNNWHRRAPFQPSQREIALRNNNRSRLITQYGTPEQNPNFWNSIDPAYFTKDINAPIQLQTGENDEEVPADFSRNLYTKLISEGKVAEFYSYPGDNHNISENFNLAMQRSLGFFDKYLKE